MIEDKNQALLDMLLGWRRFIGSHSCKPYTDAYPSDYQSLLRDLYAEAGSTLEKEGDAADFVKRRLLPLFGLEGARTMYGWTEQDALDYWEELRREGKVKDQPLSPDEAQDILRRALRHYSYTNGSYLVRAEVEQYVEENELFLEGT